MSNKLTLKQIYSKKYLGYGYKKYADKLQIAQIKLYTKSNKNADEIIALKKLRKEYYLMSIMVGNINCAIHLVQLYIKSGEYEKIIEMYELIKYNNNKYYNKTLDDDELNKHLMECSIVNNNKILVEEHFNKIVNKCGKVYFSIGIYYKNIKDDQLAIKNLKFASDNRCVDANYIIGTWYVYTKDNCNATKYFLKIFSYSYCHREKIKALQCLLEIKNKLLVSTMLKKILDTCDAILLSKKTSKYKANKTERYKKCCKLLKINLCNIEEYETMITELYTEMIDTNDKIKNVTPEKLTIRLNEIFSRHPVRNRHVLDIYTHVDILIWFNYHKINKKHYDLFLQYPTIAKRIDKWIKISEKHYMKLEDKNILSLI